MPYSEFNPHDWVELRDSILRRRGYHLGVFRHQSDIGLTLGLTNQESSITLENEDLDDDEFGSIQVMSKCLNKIKKIWFQLDSGVFISSVYLSEHKNIDDASINYTNINRLFGE
jgi:hypothetical protein